MERSDVERIGQRVRAERLRLGITQTELADQMSVLWLAQAPNREPITQKWISALENATMKLTNLERVAIAAIVLGVPVSTLIEDAETDALSDQSLRMVLRMHGLSAGAVSDVIREFRLLETQTRKEAVDVADSQVTPSPDPSVPPATTTPNPASGKRRRTR